MRTGETLEYAGYKLGRFILCRLEQDAELVQSILEFAQKKQVKIAVFSVIGSVKEAEISYYDQRKHTYLTTQLRQPLEIAYCFGNLSSKEGMPFAHAHVVLADLKGKSYGGHLIKARVFAAELHLQELLGERAERERDMETGLSLWKFEG